MSDDDNIVPFPDARLRAVMAKYDQLSPEGQEAVSIIMEIAKLIDRIPPEHRPIIIEILDAFHTLEPHEQAIFVRSLRGSGDDDSA